MARLLFLGASVSQLPAIRFARMAGHEVVACDGDPHAVAFGLCDVAEAIDFSNVERVAAVGRRVVASSRYPALRFRSLVHGRPHGWSPFCKEAGASYNGYSGRTAGRYCRPPGS